jgi:uncharacterized protein with von Willebrand factor type A (vWA) domain
LRVTHGFALGPGETHDAVRALEVVGVTSLERVRAALRAIACGSPEDVAAFDTAFSAAFLNASEGALQPPYAPRHSRPGALPRPDARTPDSARAADPRDDDAEFGDEHRAASERRATDESADAARAWHALRARYSPAPADAEPPVLVGEGLTAMEAAARALVRSVRLGRARRPRPQPHGPRFDVRRTLRASLQTGGDPAEVHRLGPPRRAPRIVVIVDGSRSMAEHAAPLLQLAYALVRASRATRVYSFSTELTDLTRELRAARPGSAFPALGGGWGGGTRLGASLATFLRERPRDVNERTLAIVASDGLDESDGAQLARAMRELRRRAAAVVWLNPHARTAGFAPAASGMRAAAPYIDILDAARNAGDVARVAKRLRGLVT